MLSDADIRLLWATNNQNPYYTAATMAETLAARFANEQSVTIADVSVSPGVESPAVAYANIAKRLRREGATRTAVPVAGGISVSAKRAEEGNTDRVDNAFTVNLHEIVSTRPHTDERIR